MKCIVIAGGAGSRPFPLIRVTMEQLLPVCNQSINCYPLETLVYAGIQKILRFTGGQDASHFPRRLANKKGLRLPPNHAEETP